MGYLGSILGQAWQEICRDHSSAHETVSGRYWCPDYWVAYIGETMAITIYTHYGKLINEETILSTGLYIYICIYSYPLW